MRAGTTIFGPTGTADRRHEGPFSRKVTERVLSDASRRSEGTETPRASARALVDGLSANRTGAAAAGALTPRSGARGERESSGSRRGPRWWPSEAHAATTAGTGQHVRRERVAQEVRP